MPRRSAGKPGGENLVPRMVMKSMAEMRKRKALCGPEFMRFVSSHVFQGARFVAPTGAVKRNANRLCLCHRAGKTGIASPTAATPVTETYWHSMLSGIPRRWQPRKSEEFGYPQATLLSSSPDAELPTPPSPHDPLALCGSFAAPDLQQAPEPAIALPVFPLRTK